jgi:Rhodopirellula transposase DDE domain
VRGVLLEIVAPHTAGDPMSTDKWLNCRLADIQAQLAERGYRVSLPVISRLLQAADYRLRANRKQLSGTSHPDRDTQFRHIQEQRAAHLGAAQPVISVDTKKKELIGNFKQAGRSWGVAPEAVNDHDFPQDALGRAVPYGIYDLMRNAGAVYVGQSADTPQFAVDNIAAWCAAMLPVYYPGATRLLIEADGGGSNGSRSRVWKAALQEQVADRFGLEVTVCHYPPGCSKWNWIEHRLFSEISKTWAGCPLRTWEHILRYIRETTTSTGLTVTAQHVTTVYPLGVKISDEVMASLHIQAHNICPMWNYTIYPQGAAAAVRPAGEFILL